MYLLIFYLLGVLLNIFLFIKGRIEEENSININFMLDLLLIITLSWLLYFIYYIRREGIYL